MSKQSLYTEVVAISKLVEKINKIFSTNISAKNSILSSIASDSKKILRNNTQILEPSPFKQASAFSIAFMMANPINGDFSKSKLCYHRDLSSHNKHASAIVLYEYVRYSLYGDSCSVGGKQLRNPIKLSEHFYKDLIKELSNIKDDKGFHFLSLLIETLVLSENPHASYPKNI